MHQRACTAKPAPLLGWLCLALQEPLARRVFSQLLDAVAYCHQQARGQGARPLGNMQAHSRRVQRAAVLQSSALGALDPQQHSNPFHLMRCRASPTGTSSPKTCCSAQVRRCFQLLLAASRLGRQTAQALVTAAATRPMPPLPRWPPAHALHTPSLPAPRAHDLQRGMSSCLTLAWDRCPAPTRAATCCARRAARPTTWRVSLGRACQLGALLFARSVRVLHA